jgi:hypothetical protein
MDLAWEYLPWFATHCHFTPDQVFDMPFMALVKLTLHADDLADEHARTVRAAADASRTPRLMY